jgi:magnesium chelatase accessory protein
MPSRPDIFVQEKKFVLEKRGWPGHPVWKTDGKDWPNRKASQFVALGLYGWHVQMMGTGPVILLLHGTGAATHSWRDLMPNLAKNFTVVAMDLRGHGFSAPPDYAGEMSLPKLTEGVAKVVNKLPLGSSPPVLIVGHSAGAAIAVELCQRRMMAPRGVVALNGAMLPFGGPANPIFTPLAKIFASNALVPSLFSWHAADPQVVARLLARTGSTIDAEGMKFYAMLARFRGHAASALKMMANWDLPTFAANLPNFTRPLLMINGGNDLTIPPATTERVSQLVKGSRVIQMPGLGHLAHEERPAEVAALIVAFAREIGALPA